MKIKVFLGKYIKYTIGIYIITIITACTPRLNLDNIDFEPQIVVEGWIENGEMARVLLTQWLPIDSDGKEIPAMDVPIRWAKVTLSDGEREEVLVGRKDKNYISSFVYTSSKIYGECGKKYFLKVEYSGRTLTAETQIPDKVNIESFRIGRHAEKFYNIIATFKDDLYQENYYKFFSKVKSVDKRFMPSFMGTVTDKISINGEINLEVNRGYKYDKEEILFTPYYTIDDTVTIKLTQISKEVFNFWNDYENEALSGKNPLFPSSTNLRSNINGGKGIWAGYAKDEKIIIIKEHLNGNE